ncbi:DNA cytosine methyltransferase [Polymorphospora lycopeni]|uniref:DNA (cytosine-5-)-methyltransferase n=1 Tax=Polymorphospora lycopeni TaxID=3140240 RepID=A0ABV5CLB6_9ACTN
MILDAYAGAGGWDQGARMLGLPTVGLEKWHDACITAVKAGHPRIRCDVATYPTAPFVGRVTGYIASPPCQAFSPAGKRAGEQDKERVHQLIDDYAAGGNDPGDGWADDRSHHAAQPVRWIRDLRPPWAALEQVPPVLDLWQHIGDVLRGWGYSVWTGILNAADYGVPQTRRRAILIASRVRPVFQPETTHEQNPPASALFGARFPWVSMAQALGWTGIDGPARTVCGARSPRWAYGQGSSYATGWTLETENRTETSAGRLPYRRSVDRPAPTVVSNAGRWELHAGERGNATVRSLDEPAATVLCSRPGNLTWKTKEASRQVGISEAAVLQSFPADYPWHGTKTSQFLQVANAVPPVLATAIVAAAAGVGASRQFGVAA